MNPECEPAAQDDKEARIVCLGGCSRAKSTAEAAELSGWEFLPVTLRYRCGECTRNLRACA